MSGCRCISVNSQVESDFGSHTIHPQSILIEDINQDNKNEIIIGTINGEILVYKGTFSQPWLRSTKQMASITCLAFDNITDSKTKLLIAHDALGYVYLYTISHVPIRRRYASDISSTKSNPSDWKYELTNLVQIKLLLNPKFILTDNLYNNGMKRMIIGYTDRVIRVFKWVSINNQVIVNSNSYSNTPNNQKSSSNTLNQANYAYSLQETGKFILEQTWELPDQINSIHIYKDSLNVKHLFVTQPGAQAFICKPIQVNEQSNESNSSSSSSLTDLVQNSLVLSNTKSKLSHLTEESINFYNDLSNTEVDKSTIQTYLVTNVNYNKSDQYGFMITLNGDIFFFKQSLSPSIVQKTSIWHININALVMKYFKADINKDGNDELIIATPEGQVFVINCSGGYMCFDLGEPIRIFHLGHYSSEIPTLNLIETGTSSEADLHQFNATQAFELALEASPISNNKQDESQLAGSSNLLSFIYVSSITNKICLVQTDSIIASSKLKTSSQLKYRCENIFSHRKNFSDKLQQLLDDQGNKGFDSKILHDLLYSN